MNTPLMLKRKSLISLQKSKDTTIDLSLCDINGNYVGLRNTANCYVIHKDGCYKLPLVYGNGIKNNEINYAAFTDILPTSTNTSAFSNHKLYSITTPYIEEMPECTAISASLIGSEFDNNVIKNIHFTTESGMRFLNFEISGMLECVEQSKINSVIGIFDCLGQCMWSGHLWLYSKDLISYTATNHSGIDYEFLEVSIGCSQLKISNNNCELFYQGGRKDPMPRSLANSSEDYSPLYGSMPFQKVAMAKDLSEGIKHPNYFFIQGGAHNDWQDLFDGRVNHGNANQKHIGITDDVVIKTIYDPSPVGYKVPNANAFSGFTTTGKNSTNISEFNITFNKFYQGGYFNFKSGTTNGFHATGLRHRSSGDLFNVGVYNSCGTSDSETIYQPYAFVSHSTAVSVAARQYKSLALTIRPIKDN